jgi:hypothetical protein
LSSAANQLLLANDEVVQRGYREACFSQCVVVNGAWGNAMIIYIAKHSSGLIKIRRSQHHTTRRYTHAVWARDPRGKIWNGKWQCRAMGQRATALREQRAYADCGYEVEITRIIAQ